MQYLRTFKARAIRNLNHDVLEYCAVLFNSVVILDPCSVASSVYTNSANQCKKDTRCFWTRRCYYFVFPPEKTEALTPRSCITSGLFALQVALAPSCRLDVFQKQEPNIVLPNTAV
jgi:hypothetical protein